MKDTSLILRPPSLDDAEAFVQAMQKSQSLHYPWVNAPLTLDEFHAYYERNQLKNQASFLLCLQSGEIAGVFNLNEIVRGLFQNAFLGYYAIADQAGKGYMSLGLKMLLHKVFNDLQLHRIEANIQPDNVNSISLVKNNFFRKEGYSPRYLKINGEWQDHERWAMTYEDWLALCI